MNSGNVVQVNKSPLSRSSTQRPSEPQSFTLIVKILLSVDLALYPAAVTSNAGGITVMKQVCVQHVNLVLYTGQFVLFHRDVHEGNVNVVNTTSNRKQKERSLLCFWEP